MWHSPTDISAGKHTHRYVPTWRCSCLLYTSGEIETVGNGITQIIVVYQVETVAQEDFFQAAGTFTVYFHFIKKVVLIFISCFKHGGKSILSRVAGAGGECIEYAVDEYCAEGAAAVALCQPGIGPVIQFVRNAADTDTLTGIAESFGTGNEQHVICLLYTSIYGKAFVRDDAGNIVYGTEGDNTGMPLVEGDGNTVKVGNANPKLMLGWNHMLSYKNFSFYFLVDCRFGGDILSQTQADMDMYGVSEVTARARDKGYVMLEGNRIDNVKGFYKNVVGGRDVYKRQVEGRSTFHITLREDMIELDNVIVTALGIEKKENSLSYATDLIKNEELTRVKMPNLITSLTGKSAGVRVNQVSSGLGASAKVSIRGIRSVASDNQPLYVIDGVPVLNSTSEQDVYKRQH